LAASWAAPAAASGDPKASPVGTQFTKAGIIIARGTLGAVKLNKILYYADMLQYAHTGNAITGATYVKQERGPVPKQVLPAIDLLKKAGRLSWQNVSVFDFVRREFTAHGETDDSVFSKEEIERLDHVINLIAEFSAGEISDISHTIVWKAAKLGETLPYESFFLSYLGDITDNDMTAVQTSIKEVEKKSGRIYG
jgi:Protein of unknown function (DUF4065)